MSKFESMMRVASRKHSLTASQKLMIAKALVRTAKDEEELAEDPKVREIVQSMRAKIPVFNKLRNRKLKQLIPGVNGAQLIQMKLIDLLTLVQKIGE